MSGPSWTAPALRTAVTDRRLRVQERLAVAVLWQELSVEHWRPMKAEALAVLLGVTRQNAARILRRLIDAGYLVAHQPDPRAARLFLLVNVVAPRVAYGDTTEARAA